MGAGGDHHVLGIAFDVLGRHQSGESLPQSEVPLTPAVLQRHRAVLGEHAPDGVEHVAGGQGLHERHAACERHDLGT